MNKSGALETSETPRLRLRPLTSGPGDAAFVLQLLNDPAWLSFIGDRGVRTLKGAKTYIESNVWSQYRNFGVGPLVVESRTDAMPMGICGLFRRETLSDFDLGFGFLPAFRGHGYAREACDAVLDHARTHRKLTRVVAIATPRNADSIRLLERLGFIFERDIEYGESREEVRLFALALTPSD